MRSYDLTPFYRSTVGFDRFFSLLDQAAADGSPGYPPYNIERTGENAYRIRSRFPASRRASSPSSPRKTR